MESIKVVRNKAGVEEDLILPMARSLNFILTTMGIETESDIIIKNAQNGLKKDKSGSRESGKNLFQYAKMR